MEPANFIEEIASRDVEQGVYSRPVMTRFPPEPAGYLHIGHAKGIFASYGLAEKFGGYFNLRMDDTDPEKDYEPYVPIVIEDVGLLGIDVGDRIYHASSYFGKLYEFAVELVKRGKAFVCDLSEEELKACRGDFYTRGRPSPYRDRPVDENIGLLERMKNGEFEDGTKTLRAKIDYDADNVLMRDPVMYRILKRRHYRLTENWNIYPMYDFAHCLSDAIEGVTHSLCGKEFEVHHALYDWFLEALDIPEPPKQIEYAELKISNTILGKRYLRKMINAGMVSGWDDPRLMTIRGLRRRGYSPRIIRLFFDRLGLSRSHSLVDIRFLEACCREVLNAGAPRRMAVLRPLEVVIENYPEGIVESLDAVNNPEDPAAGSRKIPFSGKIFIERDDFMVDPPPKYYRLTPDREVRLRYAYFIRCVGYETDPSTGEVTRVRATYDPATKGGDAPDGRKVKSTLHWVSAAEAKSAEVRLYDVLTTVEDSSVLTTEEEILRSLNPQSVEVLESAMVEPSLSGVLPGSVCQFERLGYFCADPDSDGNRMVYNRTVTLKDAWAKIQKKSTD